MAMDTKEEEEPKRKLQLADQAASDAFRKVEPLIQKKHHVVVSGGGGGGSGSQDRSAISITESRSAEVV